MLTNNIIFYSDESSIKISVNKDLFNKMYQYCDKSYPNETGGILIGTYLDKQTAEIVAVIGPSEDSKTWKTRFNRGAKGINKLLKEYWEQGIYYLGEWHFHPNGSPYPSNIDTDTLTSISNNSKYSCPEPILIIISGSHNCYNQKSYLYSSTGQKFEMNC
ncbi:Mov34/MPN/PAD-1 family protein [Clostridium saccharoperbutylacetonicum]|uniref:Mov34/MPN/PAD-1 family protein n=1 Tax=Clostridium saccharoperbutylacetonicum TaxID=36745 RepID=UPI0009838C31|nr:Mov34/MPN/PAD-1 family protein [Clostridium saccharoperbutylacetonicum]AQR93108.1 Mov34/MPN/PAD-1 family protein [Clostridium saccharoperbutylacetonicum]NSB34518.1 integrative and conjugative element protein (TIGR02256 family) [Clostridium saccharoperbutylacetonicum]